MREIGLREIAEASKISLRYLEAFEQDRADLLPAPVFARGFLREYARYVGLNPDEVVNYFLSTHSSTAGTATPAAAATPRRGRELLYGFALAGGTAALLGIVALLSYLAERRQDSLAAAPPPLIATPPVVVAPPPAAAAETAAPRAPLRLSLQFLQDCWVERIVDGGARVSELRVRGETLQIEAEESVLLTFGNAPGVRLEVNGTAYPLPAPDGTVVRDLRIALADLDAGVKPAAAPPPPI